MNKPINYFYDLPVEIINKIYCYDSTYHLKYKEIIEIINKFPKFIYKKDDFTNYFIKFFKNINLEQKFMVKSVNYKKSLLIASSLFLNSNTFSKS